jgi:RecJ-like exonuclease
MKPCPMCKGNGEIEMKADTILQCMFCSGTGEVNEKTHKVLSDLIDSCNDAKNQYVCFFHKNRE